MNKIFTMLTAAVLTLSTTAVAAEKEMIGKQTLTLNSRYMTPEVLWAMGNNTVESLFKGMDSFITTKTVVGDAVHIGDTIILPLVDVSFGVAAGAFSDRKSVV